MRKKAVAAHSPGIRLHRCALVLGLILVGTPLARGQDDPFDGWTDPPPENQAGTDVGDYTADPNYKDEYGDPELQNPHQGLFGKAVNELERVDPQAAEEIRAAYDQGRVGFLVIKKTTAWGSARRTNARINLVFEGRDEYGICGTLAHEWEHMRRMRGAGGAPPKEKDDEDLPCSHVVAACKRLQTLEELAEWYQLEVLPPPIECEDWVRAEKTCEKFTRDCLAAQGTPECNCGDYGPIINCR